MTDAHFIRPDNDDLALLPCPFCGREAKRHDIEAREDVDNAGASYIECTGCGACTQLHFDRKENLLDSWNRRWAQPSYDPTTQPFDEPFRHACLIRDHQKLTTLDAGRSSAWQWRAFYNVSYPKLWGIETNDPTAIEAGLEIVVAPCMPEHAAKDIAAAWNAKGALSLSNGDR